jgi:SAM-dependent MidA family methyltransferase
MNDQSMDGYLPWVEAWNRALYGPKGFYRRREGPAGHFRTAAHAAPDELAEALARLAAELRCPAIVDVGAGRGELLTALARHPGLSLWGVDVVPRPDGLAPGIGWSAGLPALPDAALDAALVMGWELLDVVPVPVLEVDGEGVARVVTVQPATGQERLGEPAGTVVLDWCRRWWSLDGAQEGDRVEVGEPRDALWAALVARARRAGARAVLAVDYAHRRTDRPARGSLPGFRAGRAVPPRPDGSMDVTAHVGLDAVADAGLSAGATSSTLTTQREALRALGVRRGELLDPGGLGGFGWLLQHLDGLAG